MDACINELIITLGVAFLVVGWLVALAIAFGIGGREIAARELDVWLSSVRESKDAPDSSSV